tara:strand:- start:695 stop:1006 length:312 start_codon:yes stop_codon:yes gene_type:complete
MSVELSVSNENLNCLELSNFLTKCGVINASVISNIGIVEKKIERGCVIRLGTEYATRNHFLMQELWNNLERKYHFDCAYLSIPSIYSGCIKDWIRKSDCPGKN